MNRNWPRIEDAPERNAALLRAKRPGRHCAQGICGWLDYLGRPAIGLATAGLMFGLALPARAAIVFTNLTAFTGQSPRTSLTALAYVGTNTFVVAGLNSNILTARFLGGFLSGFLSGFLIEAFP